MPDASDGLTIRFRPNAGRGDAERIRLEPRTDGMADYYEHTWNGCKWLPRGHDVVADLQVEGAVDGAAVLTRPDGGEVEATPAEALDRHLRAALETVAGDDVDTRFHLRQARQLVEAIAEDV